MARRLERQLAPLAATGPAETLPADWVLRLLTIVWLASFVAFLVVGEHFGWTVADPLKQQVTRIVAKAPGCEHVDAYPPAGAGIERSDSPNDGVLVVVAAAAGCGISDAVRLHRLAATTPEAGPVAAAAARTPLRAPAWAATPRTPVT